MEIRFNEVYTGKVSFFGGPSDTGVKWDEGLSLYNKASECPKIFLPAQPPLLKTDPGYPGLTTGLARRLNPKTYYCAAMWYLDITPKSILRTSMVQIKKHGGNFSIIAYPADTGPHPDTGRVLDVSEAVMKTLGLQTDDLVDFKLFQSAMS